MLTTENVMQDESYNQDVIQVPPGPYVRLSVSDDGIGMDRETRARAFDPFFSTKAQDEGTGLGLATVYAAVKQSGGFVWVYSEEGEGTTFKIYLPRVEAAEDAVVTAERITGPLAGTESVLVVDDDDAGRDFVAKVLRRYGYRVLAVDTAQEARHRLGTLAEPPQLLITDLVLGAESGRDLARAARAQLPGMRVIVMSGYAEHTLPTGGAPSVSEFLQKPFSSLALVSKVRELLDR